LAGAAQNLGGAGDFDRAVAYATAALAEPEIAGDPERGAQLWQRIARYHLQEGNGPPAFAAYDAAAKLLDSAPAARGRSRLAADHALALALWDRNGEAVTQAERAVCLAADEGDLAARGLALNASGVARTAVGRIEDGEPDFREALDLARAHGSIEDTARATMNLGYTLLSSGRDEEALALIETAIADNEALGFDLRRGALNRINAGEALFALGRWDEAIAQAEAVRNRIEFRFAGRRANITRARVATARGEDELAASLLSWVEPDGQGQGQPHIGADWRLVVAESAAWAGRYDEGRAAVAAGLELVAGNDAWHTARLCAVGVRLEVDRCFSAHARRARSEEAGARRRADELVARAVEVSVDAGEIGAWVAQARAEYLRLGGSDGSSTTVAEWTGVRERWRSFGQPYPEAYASLRLAEAELAAGNRRAATRELATAATLAEALGAAPLAALIADVVHRAGIETVPAPTLGGLTAREREILARVVAGESNRDIATALFISPKTVSVHVSALLRKFGVSGRGDLSAAMQASELGAPPYG
jgi:DNA-binding CsgD family transcriptional regulator